MKRESKRMFDRTRMHRLAGLLLSVFAVVATSSPSTAQMSPKQIFDKWGASVVTVKTPSGSGTGFFVSSGCVYTAYHVMDGADSASITFSDGTVEPITSVLGADKSKDVALLWVNELTAHAGRMGPPVGEYSKITPGDKIVVIGSPLGLSQTVTDGIVSAKRVEEGSNRLQISAAISHGSSGSPVFNSGGEVVGMVVSMSPDGQLLNFAVPSDDLLSTFGLPIKSTFAPNHTFAPPVANTEPGIITLESLASMSSNIAGKTNAQTMLMDCKDFAISALSLGNKQALSSETIAKICKSVIASKAPRAKIVDNAVLEKRYQSLNMAGVTSALSEYDGSQRSLFVSVSVTPAAVGHSKNYCYDITLSFKRGIITQHGLDYVFTFIGSVYGAATTLIGASSAATESLKKTLYYFCDNWNKANPKQ